MMAVLNLEKKKEDYGKNIMERIGNIILIIMGTYKKSNRLMKHFMLIRKSQYYMILMTRKYGWVAVAVVVHLMQQ